MKVIMLKNKKREIRNCLVAILSSAFLAFGLYHVHSLSGVTEGGVLGMTLLLDHWFGISPAFSGFVMNVLCYCLGWKLMGKEFLGYSIVATASFLFLIESMSSFLIFGHSLHRCRCLPLYWVQFLSVWELDCAYVSVVHRAAMMPWQ